jgi:hypothetical protein
VSIFDFIFQFVPPKARLVALRVPAEVEVCIAENSRGGWSIYPANTAARRLFGTPLPANEGECGNFGTYAAAHQRAADHNCWRVVEAPELPHLWENSRHSAIA